MTNNEWELDSGNHMFKIQKALGSIPSNKRNKKLKESFSFERSSLLLCVCNVCVWAVGVGGQLCGVRSLSPSQDFLESNSVPRQ